MQIGWQNEVSSIQQDERRCHRWATLVKDGYLSRCQAEDAKPRGVLVVTNITKKGTNSTINEIPHLQNLVVVFTSAPKEIQQRVAACSGTISTSKGVKTEIASVRLNFGGELLLKVY